LLTDSTLSASGDLDLEGFDVTDCTLFRER
jgi:hypothetical protein